ncbi:helix-turn-helix domain-containing protein [Halobacterium wangiae]|uniref:helix-turn-helix domain-containing protein n=1 Tax=Halobacterium wangiae TaxID=2902623 RepID=UPI001E490D7D|nr:helix-turn-helix domain-containing protein [Halobacterium wangiae]
MSDGDGFDVLADETRAGIVRALAVARRDDPRNPHRSFSELQDDVGATDSGRFNYHLGKVRGHFVTQTEDGYTLSAVGQRAAGAILSGSFDDPPEHDPVDLDEDCGRCGEPVTAQYEDGLLLVGCENDHRFGDSLPPATIEENTLRESIDVLDAKMRGDVELARRGACPTCFGPVAWSFHRDLDPEAPVEQIYTAECQQCGQQLGVPPGLVVHDHPALVAAYRDAGVDLREQLLWTVDCCLPGASELVSEDPVRVAIDAGPHGDQRFVLDATADVVTAPNDASR